MQKLFSAFPDGWPGMGLVLLRVAVAVNAICQGLWALESSCNLAFILRVVALSAILVGLALLIGFLTPVVGASAAIGYAVIGGSSLLHGGEVISFHAPAALNFAVISIALTFLGPGAFSLDARLFGMREIIIPEEQRPPRK